MNQHELTALEEQLKSWKPRKPSSALESQIFSSTHGPVPSRRASTDAGEGARPWFEAIASVNWASTLLRWLAPVSVCGLMMILALQSRAPLHAARTSVDLDGGVAHAALTNQSLASYLSSVSFVEHNGLPSGLSLAQRQ